MNRTVYILSFVMILLAATGCEKLGLYTQDKGELLASVADKDLYYDDVKGLFPAELTPTDSIAFLDSYIASWIRSEVKTLYAEQAMTDNEADIDEMVKNYRKSLITFKYESGYVQDHLDTVVTSKQIESYYNDNRSSFLLAGPVVKAAVARVPLQLRQAKKIENLFSGKSEQDWQDFIQFAQKNNIRVYDYMSDWIDFSVVLQHIPFSQENFDEFLRTKKFYEVEDDQFKYMMKIEGYKPTGDYSPLELESDKIRKILLNLRRAEIIKLLEDSLQRVAIDEKLVVNKFKK